MGQADYKENRYHKAIENYELGLEKAEEINYAFMMQQISYSLSWVYEQIDNHKLALSYYNSSFFNYLYLNANLPGKSLVHL